MKSFKGFTILEMMIVVAILGLLLVFALPNFTKSKEGVYREECIDNLRRIHTAKELYAIEHNKGADYEPKATDLDPYIKGGTASLVCPSDPGKSFSTSYLINKIGTKTPPTCNKNGDHKITP